MMEWNEMKQNRCKSGVEVDGRQSRSDCRVKRLWSGMK